MQVFTPQPCFSNQVFSRNLAAKLQVFPCVFSVKSAAAAVDYSSQGPAAESAAPAATAFSNQVFSFGQLAKLQVFLYIWLSRVAGVSMGID